MHAQKAPATQVELSVLLIWPLWNISSGLSSFPSVISSTKLRKTWSLVQFGPGESRAEPEKCLQLVAAPACLHGYTHPFFCRSWRPRRPGERFYRSTQKGFRGFRSFGRLHSGGFWESGGFPGSWECSLFSRQQWLRCFACPWEEKQEGGLGLQGEASQFIQELGAQQVRPLPAGPLLSLALLLSVRIPEWPWASAGRPQPRLPKPALLLWLVVSFARAALGTAAPSFLLLRAAYCGPCGSDNPWPSLLEKDKEDVWEVSVFSLRSASGF